MIDVIIIAIVSLVAMCGWIFAATYAKQAKDIEDLHRKLIDRYKSLQKAADATDDEILLEFGGGESLFEFSYYPVRVKLNPELDEGSFNMNIETPLPDFARRKIHKFPR